MIVTSFEDVVMSVRFALETAHNQAVRQWSVVLVLTVRRGLLKTLDATSGNSSSHTYLAGGQQLHKTPVDKLPAVQL